MSNFIYHVAKNGNDSNKGSEAQPFLTINKAAKVAVSGDTIIVHEGIYREWVNPINGGSSASSRITYQVADGEKVTIKGSERINTWEQIDECIWKVTLPNTLFGDFNPYEESLYGDWFLWPKENPLHLGEIYLNGVALYETSNLEEVYKGQIEDKVYLYVENRKVCLDKESKYPKLTSKAHTCYKWYTEVSEKTTNLYVYFGKYNPNTEEVEINVRKSCFYPKETGVNYITVKGFEIAHAATPFAPPTSEQVGAIGPHWSKGWIIEDNCIHDSKCSGISLGKEYTTGHNDSTRFGIRSAYQGQLEAVFKAIQIGWSKETVGSHVVKNNTIYDCGQAGIVGHMGCVFSEIVHNHIYNIGNRYQFFGWEIAGIKLHAPIDTVIDNNYIHNTSLGIWLDWQTQGTRVSRNILSENGRDFVTEVSHGPYIVEHNIFLSNGVMGLLAQGGAFVHNLICNPIHSGSVLERATPYHFNHSTDIAGYSMVYGNDDRFMNNVFIGQLNGQNEKKPHKHGTCCYNGSPTSLKAYLELVEAGGNNDLEKFIEQQQPVYIEGNVYYAGAKPFDCEQINHTNEELDTMLNLIEEKDGIYLEWTVDKALFGVRTKIQSTETLGSVRIVNSYFEDAKGDKIRLDKDFVGKERRKRPCPGPFEGLKSGYNKIKIWSFLD